MVRQDVLSLEKATVNTTRHPVSQSDYFEQFHHFGNY